MIGCAPLLTLGLAIALLFLSGLILSAYGPRWSRDVWEEDRPAGEEQENAVSARAPVHLPVLLASDPSTTVQSTTVVSYMLTTGPTRYESFHKLPTTSEMAKGTTARSDPSAVALMIVGQLRGFPGLASLEKFLLTPWRKVRNWRLDVFVCTDKNQKMRLAVEKFWAFKSSSQLERIGLCAQRIQKHEREKSIQYRFFVRWRPDFVLMEEVKHPSMLHPDCIGCRFRSVSGMAHLEKGLLSWEPPGCIRKNVYNHACGDCDDQVFVVPGHMAKEALVDLAYPLLRSSTFQYFVQKRKGENGLTMAWVNNIQADYLICPLSVPGTLSKYAGVWRSWRMPKSYWNSSNGADPKKPQRMRPCGCCCGFEEQIRVCSSVHCSGKSPPTYCRP